MREWTDVCYVCRNALLAWRRSRDPAPVNDRGETTVMFVAPEIAVYNAGDKSDKSYADILAAIMPRDGASTDKDNSKQNKQDLDKKGGKTKGPAKQSAKSSNGGGGFTLNNSDFYPDPPPVRPNSAIVEKKPPRPRATPITVGLEVMHYTRTPIKHLSVP
jgi:hypothetical protein